MEYLEGMIKLVEREFGEMTQNGKFRNRDDVEIAYKLMDIAKDAFCIWKYEEEMQEGNDYSEYGRSYGYNSGNSYARGMNVRRNSLGQYSREGNDSYNTYGRSRSLGYSRTDAKEEYMNNLYAMLDNAPDKKTHDHVQRMIHEMEMEQ